ncbi:hypothetical protein AC578_10177, partial [Pseudocercospora eumusae]
HSNESDGWTASHDSNITPPKSPTCAATPVPTALAGQIDRLSLDHPHRHNANHPLEQLGAEVKGIYTGLVMVEAKCISIDAALAADPRSDLGPRQWQALIALHRTLLYEHYDFVMVRTFLDAQKAADIADLTLGYLTSLCHPSNSWSIYEI